MKSGSARDTNRFGELLYREGRFSTVVIESVYLKMNVATAMRLTEVATTCAVLAQIRNPGAEVFKIAASAWQARQLRVGHKTKRVDRKRLSILVAREIARRDVTEDEADAINLGDYFIRYGGIHGSTQGPGAPAAGKKAKGDKGSLR
ncbi:hypothetical protein M0R72_06295 [Candidatus Pacearchaeota archaeon]|nr:hypothetical protein [Candidatus Pacearchaeota archaeon]